MTSDAAIPIVAFVGRSNTGKTTLLEKLIPLLRRRGHRIAVVKHSHHVGAPFGVPRKDSARLVESGADQVVLAAPDQMIHLRRYEQEPALAEVVADIRDVDLIIVEGYKCADVPKIEVSRRERGTELVCEDDEWLIGVASDQRYDVDVPQFDLDDVIGVAGLIETRFLK
jgi:molybdopterin-guanine dinucleotide biosynthesis protein B